MSYEGGKKGKSYGTMIPMSREMEEKAVLPIPTATLCSSVPSISRERSKERKCYHPHVCLCYCFPVCEKREEDAQIYVTMFPVCKEREGVAQTHDEAVCATPHPSFLPAFPCVPRCARGRREDRETGTRSQNGVSEICHSLHLTYA